MISAFSADRASSWAFTTTLRARGVKRLKPSSGSISPDPLGTNRFWAACFVTPMRLPMSVHDAPERRAWSTKWPMRWSATSSRCSAASTASWSCSRASEWTEVMALMRSSRRTFVGGMRPP